MLTFDEFRETYGGTQDSEVQAYHRYFRDHAEVGDGATVWLWSDAHAYTIIKRTPKTLTLRRCRASLADGWKPEFIPGGFSVICVNDADQRWQYEEDPDGQIVRAYWSDRYGFRVDGCQVTPGRHEHYDYNF